MNDRPTLTVKQAAAPMRRGDLPELMAALAPVIREFVDARVSPLQARIAELEARPEFKDAGVWHDGNFKHGHGVTFEGSFWIAQRDTMAKPGTSKDWRLAVKRGRDGRGS